MAFDFGTQQETIQIRYCEQPDGRVVVWIRLAGASSEVGPIELNQAEADELGAHVESATRVLWAAQERACVTLAAQKRTPQRALGAPKTKLRLV